MTAIDPVVISSRLRLISEYLEILRDFEGMELDEYLANVRHQLLAERILEIAIQAAIDINRHILRGLGVSETLNNEQAFLEMGRRSIISEELAQQLSQSGRFRNFLAHHYLDIDSRTVFSSIQDALQFYPIYLEQIIVYLETLEAENE